MSNFNNSSNQPHRYSLEKGSKKHLCPNCNKKRFVRFVDTSTGEYLPEQYGRCDREANCPQQEYNNPYSDGYAKMIWEHEQNVTGVNKVTLPKKNHFFTQPKPQHTAEPVFFDFETFKQTLQPERYKENKFIQNLFSKVKFPFEVDDITKVIQLYRLGTVANGYRAGATTFPFIDKKGNIRAIQVKQFDEQNHTTGTDFLHSIIEKHHTQTNKLPPEWLQAYTKQDKRISCLFGSHLLSKYPQNPIALVEAPKTAIYGTLYFGLPETPESLLWLAVYNKSSFTFDKLKELQGRFVYVFPDLSKDGNTFKEWETKAKEYESRLSATRFIFSDLLEQLVPEQDKSGGNDLADYLIKQDWRLFRKHTIQEQAPQPEPEKVTEVTIVTPQQNILSAPLTPLPKVEVVESKRMEQLITEQPQNYISKIEELERFFEEAELPKQSFKLNKFTTINDVSLFIESHLTTVRAGEKKRNFLSHLHSLQELKAYLITTKKQNLFTLQGSSLYQI